MGKRSTKKTSAFETNLSGRGPGEPPSHLVVFREVEESRNMSALSKNVRSFARSRDERTHNVAALLASDDVSVGEMYHDLGIAAVKLTDEQRQKLEANKDVVERVVPNEVRYVPRDPDSGRGAPPVSGLDATAGRVRPFGAVPGRRQLFGSVVQPPHPIGGGGQLQPFGLVTAAPGGLIGYLHGYRDAVVALVAQIEAMTAVPARQLRAAMDSDSATWGLTLIGISSAERARTGKGVKVAILDTGIDLTHPDFSSRLTDPTRIVSFVPGENASDGHGHGTHVAGTVAGPLGESPEHGVAPDCDLYIAKVLGNNGQGLDSDILNAIQWAITQGVRVINMSLGSPRGADEPASIAYERVAQRLLTSTDGALLVAAAGNESERDFGVIAPVGNPAACPSVMSVAAVDENGAVAPFSCGQVDSIGTVDVAAPGVRIRSTVLGGAHGLKSGTSMAAPHVTGIAALLFELKPTSTPRDVWSALKLGCTPSAAPASDVGSGVAHIP